MNKKWFCLPCIVVVLAMIDTAKSDIVGWWKFDEGSGIVAADSSGFGYDGTLHNMDNNDWVDGVLGKALELNGVDDYISIPPVNLTGINSLTITAWVKRHGDQPAFTGIVYNRDEKSQAGTGIAFGGARRGGNWQANHELSYCWNQDFWKWRSGLIVPNDKWVFIAMVVGPTEATLYLGQDDKLSSSTHRANHETISACDAVSMIGYDNYQGSGDGHGYFRGHIDDVRIYDHELDTNEIRAIYTDAEECDKTSDAEIAKHPNETLEWAYEKLLQFNGPRAARGWGGEPTDELANTLLIIAKAKEAKKLRFSEVLTDYYELIEQFPDSPHALEALCRIVALDETSGFEYADKFLKKDPTGIKAAQFYGTLVKNSLSESNYYDADRYVKSFIDKYALVESSKLMGLLISCAGQTENREQLDELIQRNMSENPNSIIGWAFFRYKALELGQAGKLDELLELARQTRRKFPETRLGNAAAAVLADEQYQQGNYVAALQELKRDLLCIWWPLPDLTMNIDDVITIYRANTLRSGGIDPVKLYESAAKYLLEGDRSLAALYCYRQGAQAGGFGLDAFEKAASRTMRHYYTDPSYQILFWEAVFEAERGDPTSATTKYELFLEKDGKSILAAKAYYDLARLKKTSGRYTEALELIAKAKTISPCSAVSELEQALKQNPLLAVP